MVWCLNLLCFKNVLFTEAAAKTGMILLLGEITSKGVVDYQRIARDTVRQIGYDDTSKGNFESAPQVRENWKM